MRDSCRFYHYGVDGFQDSGWGCGYRTVQTILSWLAPSQEVPSIESLQDVLRRAHAAAFPGPRGWIGVADAVVILDELHGALVEVLTLSSGVELRGVMPRLARHFDEGGGPLMVGGGGDVYSKTVIGVRSPAGDEVGGGGDGDDALYGLLILDPHCTAAPATDEAGMAALQAAGWAAWQPLSALRAGSFYNIALPRRGPGGAGPAAGCAALASASAPAGQGLAAADWGIEVVEAGASHG